MTFSRTRSRCVRATQGRLSHRSGSSALAIHDRTVIKGEFMSTFRCVFRKRPLQRRVRVGVGALCARETPPPTANQVPFELRGFSLAKVVTSIGATLTLYSLYAYFKSSGSASETSLTLIYGMPILLLGLALWYAELKPVPVFTTEELVALRERKATPTLKQIIRDVTRHRYGDEAHLSSALRALRVIKKGEPAPLLLRLRESREPGGEYGLTMVFECRETPFEAFRAVEDRIDTFFGSGIQHELRQISDDPSIVELKLVTCSSATADISPTALKDAVAKATGGGKTAATDATTSVGASPVPQTATEPTQATNDTSKSPPRTSASATMHGQVENTANVGTEARRNPSESLAPFALFGFRPTPLPGPPRS